VFLGKEGYFEVMTMGNKKNILLSQSVWYIVKKLSEYWRLNYYFPLGSIWVRGRGTENRVYWGKSKDFGYLFRLIEKNYLDGPK